MQNRTIVDQFYLALKAGDVDQVEQLLSQHAVEIFNYNMIDYYISAALRNNDIKILNIFLKYHLLIKESDDHVNYAIQNCTLETVKVIIKICNPDLNQINALHYAVLRGNLEIINHLLSLGVDINRKDNIIKKSVVESAMDADQAKVVKFLVDQGADIHIPTFDKRFLLATKVKDYLEANKLYCNYQFPSGIDTQAEISKLNLKIKSLEDTVTGLQTQLRDLQENQSSTANNGFRRSIFQ